MNDTSRNDKLLDDDIEKCIKSALEKFLKYPHNFFSESDAHCYLYYYFFRYGSNAIKRSYQTRDNMKTVLIHREYPTRFRYEYKKKTIRLGKGSRGHYDLVVLDPAFVKTHDLSAITAKDYRKLATDQFPQLLAAIEFKLIINPLSKNIRSEIEKDFQKLRLAIKHKQAKQGYMIIFNRSSEEKDFKDEISKYPRAEGLKIIYIESIKDPERNYDILYLGNWKYKLRYRQCKQL